MLPILNSTCCATAFKQITIASAFVFLFGVAAGIALNEEPSAASETSVSPEPPAHSAQPTASANRDPQVDAILSRLEQRTVNDLVTDVKFTSRYFFDEPRDATTKTGRLWYRKGDRVGEFKIHFNARIVRNRKHSLNEQHVFDGIWYTEVQSKTKAVTRRQIRDESDPLDPYKLGEGTFLPLPFGQPRADMYREFNIELVPPASDDPTDTDHLKLTPRPNAETAKRFSEVNLWLVRSGDLAGLPIRVSGSKLAAGRVDKIQQVDFSAPDLNPGLPDDTFRIQTPAGYQEIIEALPPRPTALNGQPAPDARRASESRTP